MPEAVVDTGLYLGISERGRFDRRYMTRFLATATRRGLAFHISALALAECASHLLHALPGRPWNAWLHSAEMRAFDEFSQSVTVHQAGPGELLRAAALARPSGVQAPPRGEPTLADAATASLADSLGAEILVTDDVRDFQRLLPDFDGDILSPAELIRALGG